MLATGCAVVLGIAPLDALAATQVDLILKNGKIATVDASNSVVSTVVVDDGRIVAVGDESIAAGYTAQRTLDLGGKTVLPGFVDNHVHPGPPQPLTAPAEVDLVHAYTWADNEKILREAVKKLPPGAWLRASAFRRYFTDAEPATVWINEDVKKIPTRWMLDKVTPNNPLIVRASQLVVANSMALRMFGITKDSPQPIAGDGKIEKDANGEPTGVLWYSVGDALEEFAPKLPPTPKLSARDELLGYKEFFVNMRHLGVTSLNIASANQYTLRVYQKLQDQFKGELPRMTVQPGLRAEDFDALQKNIAALEGYGWHTGAGNEWVKLGAIKMFLDGGYTFSRPWPINSEPHKHVETYKGGWRSEPDFFYHVFKRAHQLGWQLGIHSAGDEASVIITNVLEKVITESPREDHRHHLIHVEVGPPTATYEKMKRLGIGIALQPNFTYGLQPFFTLALKGEQLARNNPSRTILDQGVKLTFGSDERPYGPMYGLYAAVTRRGADGKVYGPEEAITLQEAIRAYTIDAAWQTFDEKTRGSIEPGKVADFAVLSDDIFTIDPLKIKDLTVTQTIINGRIFDTPAGLPNYYHPVQQRRK
jgi:predicted amidohydrolase YtcJ